MSDARSLRQSSGRQPVSPPWHGLAPLSPGTRHVFQLPVTDLPDGSSVAIPVNVVRGIEDGATLIAVAGHHGDEHEGPTALIEVWDRLQPEQMRGTLIAVPVLNPPAFRAARRTSVEDDVDLNRVFPGREDGSLTHRIAREFVDKVLVEADFVLSMHGWSAGYLVEPYVEFPGWASTSPTAWAGALAFGLPFLNPLQAGPGRLMAESTSRGIPLIEVEIGGLGSTQRPWRRLYETGTDRLLHHLGILEGPAPERGEAPCTIARRECLASTGGLWRPAVEVGERVASGQVLGTVHDLNLRKKASVEAPLSGVVGVLRLNASVLPGQLIATLFSPGSWTLTSARLSRQGSED